MHMKMSGESILQALRTLGHGMRHHETNLTHLTFTSQSLVVALEMANNLIVFFDHVNADGEP